MVSFEAEPENVRRAVEGIDQLRERGLNFPELALALAEVARQESTEEVDEYYKAYLELWAFRLQDAVLLMAMADKEINGTQ